MSGRWTETLNGNEKERAMTQRLLAAVLILAWGTVCWGQERDGVSDFAKITLIKDVLKKAQVSASLEYWGRCDGYRPSIPDLPQVRTLLQSWGGPPLQTFREMFADNPKMQMTQETDGIIRMVESDIPRDLLDVKISHIPFNEVYDAKVAQGAILSAPEVRSFMKVHHIGWRRESPVIVGPVTLPTPDMPHISGELDNVSLSQALDYVLETFPGVWVYENCPGGKKNRLVSFWFFQTYRISPAQERHEKKP
jgi:hypothetical protein